MPRMSYRCVSHIALATTVFCISPQVFAVPPVFSNQTTAAGVAMNHSTIGFVNFQYAGGGAVGDFNNDGWQDIYICSGGYTNQSTPYVPDKLFINNRDGTFTNQGLAWGLNEAHRGKGVCVGDYNNDGWLDVYVCSAGTAGQPSAPGQNKLYRNNGNGTFTNVAVAAGVNVVNPSGGDSMSACWGDYDLDGDLDLFVGGFGGGGSTNAGNRLFRNNGDGTFTDVTASIGLFNGIGAIATQSDSFADMDGDRYPELILIADFKGAGGYIGSRYFKNNGNGTFTDFTVAANLGKEENGMGQTLGDFNNDGLLDLYATSIYGNPPANWTGDKLYRNLGNHSYAEYANTAGCFDGGYGWGAVAVDFNHDGLVDIAETNGDSSSGGQYGNEQSYLWMNNGNDTFTEMAIASGFIQYGKGRALLHLDYDNDGDQDAVIVSNNEPLFLLRNDLPAGPDTHWLRVFLNTNGSFAGGPLAPNGYGAKVYATVGATTYMRSIDGGNSFMGTSELSAHFGLGSATVVDQLKINWPNGTGTTLLNVPVNQTITVSPGSSCVSDIAPLGPPKGDGVVNTADLLMVINNWGATGVPGTVIGDVTGDGTVNTADLLTIINSWGPCT
jgi:enediyne biosynthesis protein E4